MSSKYKQVKINFKPEQFQRLEELANAKGVSKADWIRQKIGAKFEESRQPTAKKEAKVTDPKVLYELQKIGTNLNQTATYANRNKALDRAILESLVTIEDRLKTLL